MVGLSAAGPLRPSEAGWKDVFDRLCTRFPNLRADRVAQVLRDCDGHAGQAASVLRELASDGVREADPDDVEHVRTLLSSSAILRHVCTGQFRVFDVNGDGVLELTEILALTNTLYENFGLPLPREGGLRSFFETFDTKGEGELSESQFAVFFERFLRYAFLGDKTATMPPEMPLTPSRFRSSKSGSALSLSSMGSPSSFSSSRGLSFGDVGTPSRSRRHEKQAAGLSHSSSTGALGNHHRMRQAIDLGSKLSRSSEFYPSLALVSGASRGSPSSSGTSSRKTRKSMGSYDPEAMGFVVGERQAPLIVA